VLSPPATLAALLALLVVVSLSIRAVAADAPAVADARIDTDPRPDANATIIADAEPVADTAPMAALRPRKRGRAKPSAPVTLAFGGDVHFERWIGTAVQSDPQRALGPLAGLLGDADLSVVNLETAVTARGTPVSKRYTFRGPEHGLFALASAGVDVVSVANNHSMDFGVQGLVDTQDAAGAAGLGLIGGGRNDTEAYRPHVAEIHGRRVAVIGATQVLDDYATTAWAAGPDRPGLASAKVEGDGLPRLLNAVRNADAGADTVVVMLHWGREEATCPQAQQEQLAGQLRDAGADIIVGGNAHRLAGGGYLDDTVVNYGLGNLVFWVGNEPAATSGVLAVTIAPDDSTTMAWRPAVLRNGVATPVQPAAAEPALADWERLRACTDLAPAPQA
jgi:poly-gamma-glutamate synthesis protein (capsule biosynthesis protein)